MSRGSLAGATLAFVVACSTATGATLPPNPWGLPDDTPWVDLAVDGSYLLDGEGGGELLVTLGASGNYEIDLGGGGHYWFLLSGGGHYAIRDLLGGGLVEFALTSGGDYALHLVGAGQYVHALGEGHVASIAIDGPGRHRIVDLGGGGQYGVVLGGGGQYRVVLGGGHHLLDLAGDGGAGAPPCGLTDYVLSLEARQHELIAQRGTLVTIPLGGGGHYGLDVADDGAWTTEQLPGDLYAVHEAGRGSGDGVVVRIGPIPGARRADDGPAYVVHGQPLTFNGRGIDLNEDAMIDALLLRVVPLGEPR